MGPFAHCCVPTDVKSIEIDGEISCSPTLEQLGCGRNGGSRLEFFYLRNPLWPSNAASSSLPSFGDIYSQLVDSIEGRLSLFEASGPQTAEGAFQELLDIVSNPGTQSAWIF